MFLAAAAQRTRRLRLVTGAVLPIFNHPLKLAGEIGMLDAISGGRLEVGFARAFLPHEFRRFGRDLDESRARFDEGLEQILALLTEEDVTRDGRFHSFRNVTSLPRPTQTPRPPVWIAASTTPESFIGAGEAGHWIMSIPMAAERMHELIGQYREAWRSAGHPGAGRIMLAFSMCCMPTTEEAIEAYRKPTNDYLAALVRAASDWADGTVSADYKGYDRMITALRRESFDTQRAKGTCWAGAPSDILDMIQDFAGKVPFEVASLQVNQHLMPVEAAAQSMRLFAAEVMPRCAALGGPRTAAVA